MKSLYRIGSLAVLLANGINFNSTHAQTVAAQIASSKSPPQVVERGPNHKVWQWQTTITGPNGRKQTQPHGYTELSTGMHYWQDNQWMESQEQINVLADGSAAAIQGRHQAYFPADIYSTPITVKTPDGLQLQSQPVGLSYDGVQVATPETMKPSYSPLIYPHPLSQ